MEQDEIAPIEKWRAWAASARKTGPVVVERGVLRQGVAEISRLTARVEELELAQAWRPIETAPHSTTVEVRVGEMSFLARLALGASMTEDETPCDQWQAVNEDEHPPCWSGGACWESNEEGIASRAPESWRMPLTALGTAGKDE